MSRVVNLHPEDLLDRSARGELSPAEKSRLDAHLAGCPSCRFELQLRADFADELESELNENVSPSAVERIALSGSSVSNPDLKKEAAGGGRVREDAPAPSLGSRWSSRRGFRRASWLLVAAAVFAVSVAGATGVGQRAWSRLVGPAPAPVAATEAAAPTHAAAKRSNHHQAAPAPSVVAPAAPSSTTDVLLAPAPAIDMPLPAVAHRAAAHAESAASVFEAATEARRHGSYARAIDLQRELLSRYPRSREAHVARETLGRLLLDRGDPAGALASFDAYIADGSGELGEEAMVGRATALDRLGRTTQAADAWRVLLAAYPETPYAAHARSRLGSSSER
jgi:TolA-binding protein